MIHYNNLRFKTHLRVYEPSEDSFLLAGNLDVVGDCSVLDMGTGVGILALVASEKAGSVLGVDINPLAVETARENARLNGIDNVRFRFSDLFDDIGAGERFDLITFNPPYLPVSERDLLGRAWSGGEGGLEVVGGFISSAPEYLKEDGSILMIVSSLTDTVSLKEKIGENRLRFEVVDSRRIFFEELYVIRCFF